MRKKRWDMIILCVMFLSAACIAGGCGREEDGETTLTGIEADDLDEDLAGDTQSADQEDFGETAALEESDGSIYIDVCGEVASPGVYELPSGSRVYEAVEKAGGMTEDAAAASLNQAEKLTDGQQVYVLSKDEASGQSALQEGAAGSEGLLQDGKININTASKDELMTLPGIGEVKAEAIVRYRETEGSFQSVEDIKKIEGIKEGVFNKIKDQIKI